MIVRRARSPIARSLLLALGMAALSVCAAPAAEAAVSFLGVAAGDASSSAATVWTRATPAGTALTLELTTDPRFRRHVTRIHNACTSDATRDATCKARLDDLEPHTTYHYRFVAATGEVSNVGRFRTAPRPSSRAPLHFGFSGDYDGLMRPFSLATVVPTQDLDFYVNLGDVIYENASDLTQSGPHNGQPYLTSPSVTLSGPSAGLNGDPNGIAVANTCKNNKTWATAAQLKADYERKYRESFLPVNHGGQNGLQALYAGQGNYTTYDNHELGNRQYINGGAPAGGPVGGPTFNDMPTGCGVDARANGSGNPGNVNDANSSRSDYINRSTGFKTVQDVFLSYQPIADRVVNAPRDPRTDGTRQLYLAQKWGKNAIYLNADTRSYRDIRLKTANGGADDTSAPRANNPGRSYLGATQLAWLEHTLLEAQRAGTRWKFVSLSDPIDQIGPIGGALSLANLPCFYAVGCKLDGSPISGPAYGPVTSDGGKSYFGGYRFERNELLRFVAEHHIHNVVFFATDDHQNRISALTYSPTGDTENQASYVKVPYAFSVVAGPLGATGPDLITNHSFEMAKRLADSLAAAQKKAGIEPLGLQGYPGLHDVYRDGDATAALDPKPVDFYSPDTFNFVVFDVSKDGRTLTVSSIGMDATAQNAGKEYLDGPQARTILSFEIDAFTDGDDREDPDDDKGEDERDDGRGDRRRGGEGE